MPRLIGDKVWHKGDEVTITSEPYTLHGGIFQDAITENGLTVSIVTPEHVANTVNRNRQEWKEQQSQFAKLKIK